MAHYCYCGEATQIDCKYRQALWDVYGILGFDQDGRKEAPIPGVLTPDLLALVVDAAREFRRDYDQLLLEIPEL